MARSLQEQLDDCDAAIADIEEGAQSYGVGNRRVDRAMYRDLCARRDRLQALVDAGSYPMVSVAQVDRPS